jgi:hypothetical protein
LNFELTKFKSFPPCVSQFTQLESLNLNSISFGSDGLYQLSNFTSNLKSLDVNPGALGISSSDDSGWQKLASQFRNLTSLTVQTASVVAPLPAAELAQLTKLETLELYNMVFTGEIPEDFLENFSNLTYFRVSGNQLTGTIPTRGWQNLREVRFDHNFFTEWPYLEAPGAPNLQTLQISQNPFLASVPNDGVFSSMTALREIQAHGLPSMKSPLPVFWATGQHKLRIFFAANTLFQGTLPPSIASPYLYTLVLSRAALCGPLPEIAAPMTLDQLHIARNHLSGNIPESWGSNLTILESLLIDRNLLQGTVPERIVRPGSLVQELALTYNYFSGPLPNVSYPSLEYFSADGTNMTWDFCAQDPSIPRDAECLFSLTPSMCSCPSFFETCFNMTDACDTVPIQFAPEGSASPIPPPTPIEPPTFVCTTPSASPDPPVRAPASCPQPSPGPLFQCVGGIWKSTGSVTQPDLVIPGVIVVVEGNLTVTDGVTFNGIDSQLLVNGCIFLGDNQVTVELTKEELELLAKEGKLPKTLITSLVENNCIGSSDLSQTTVNVKKGTGSKGCRKVKAKNSGSSKSTLQVVFEIDNSTCNMIIIIPSVIGAVIVLGVAALGIGLYLRNNKFSKDLD